MTLDEVAQYLRLHKSTVYRLTKSGLIPGSKVGGKWRFRKDAIERQLSEKE
ncbi:MAG: helix-turn-helix domain-containing protein [Chloroflexota bacterium]